MRQLWDLQSLTLLGRVVGFAGNIFSLTHINDRFYAGCQDTTIKVRTLPDHLLRAHYDVLYVVLTWRVGRQSIDVRRLLERLKSDGGPGPATVTLAQLAAWDGILVTTSEHRGYVYALTSTPRYLISGSGDGTVKVTQPPAGL
jgi:WD40 repeat protein